jgi:inner membrane protein
VAKKKGWPPVKTAWLTTAVGLTHPLLDSMTFGGGLGCGLFWPFTDERFWLPWRFIPVAPLGLYMFSERGALTVMVELLMFSPFIIYATLPRRRKAPA